MIIFKNIITHKNQEKFIKKKEKEKRKSLAKYTNMRNIIRARKKTFCIYIRYSLKHRTYIYC